jgi:hypothetical protein
MIGRGYTEPIGITDLIFRTIHRALDFLSNRRPHVPTQQSEVVGPVGGSVRRKRVPKDTQASACFAVALHASLLMQRLLHLQRTTGWPQIAERIASKQRFAGIPEFLRNVMPQPGKAGGVRSRNCGAASERHTDVTNTRQLPGAFHGSGMLAARRPSFAQLVSQPAHLSVNYRDLVPTPHQSVRRCRSDHPPQSPSPDETTAIPESRYATNFRPGPPVFPDHSNCLLPDPQRLPTWLRARSWPCRQRG